MNSIIQPDCGARTYAVPSAPRRTKPQAGGFLALAERTGDTASAQRAGAAQMEAYKNDLEKRFGPVTIRSVGKDPASLEAAGKRMSGSDIVIAPNIFEEMASDPQKAFYYEQKISYFFTDVIPKGQAFAASVGLTFEPCGVVIHEDGTVTYICGGGDTPERVAEVSRINAEKARKKAEQQRRYLEQSAAAAAQRRVLWERAAEERTPEAAFFRIGDLLKTRTVSAPAVAPEASWPAGTDIFFGNL